MADKKAAVYKDDEVEVYVFISDWSGSVNHSFVTKRAGTRTTDPAIINAVKAGGSSALQRLSEAHHFFNCQYCGAQNSLG